MAVFSDLLGILGDSFKIKINGVRLKNVAGNLAVRNTGDTADASVTASTANFTGDSIIINSDGVSGADRAITLARPVAGMTANYTLTLPPSAGSPGQFPQTDGSGNISWQTILQANGSFAQIDTTPLAFGATTTTAMFTLPANAEVRTVNIIVDTAFNGTPSLSIGISGSTSKYVPSTKVDLTQSPAAYGETTLVFEILPFLNPVGTAENLIATYSAGGATVGAARIEVEYATPS
jgi:hypothetical protein